MGAKTGVFGLVVIALIFTLIAVLIPLLRVLTMSVTPIGRQVASCPMPGFPGAQKISLTSGDCASFQTRACSRPPEPTTRTLMRGRV